MTSANAYFHTGLMFDDPRLLTPLLVALSVCGVPARVAAQRQDEPAEISAEERTTNAEQAGMFLPFTEAPRVDTQRAFGTVQGGYEGAREAGVLEGRAEVTVWGPIAVRVGILYTGEGEGEEQERAAGEEEEEGEGRLRPSVGARVQALSQDGQGIDLSIGVFYKPEGFTEAEGEIEGVIALGRRFGQLGLIADLVYGQDPEGRERDGEVRLAGLYDVMPRFVIGLDSRLRFDLGTEEEKFAEEGGAEYDLVAGPLAGYVLGPVAFNLVAGVSVVGTPDTLVGPIALASISGTL
jgi:hypothetical protein